MLSTLFSNHSACVVLSSSQVTLLFWISPLRYVDFYIWSRKIRRSELKGRKHFPILPALNLVIIDVISHSHFSNTSLCRMLCCKFRLNDTISFRMHFPPIVWPGPYQPVSLFDMFARLNNKNIVLWKAWHGKIRAKIIIIWNEHSHFVFLIKPLQAANSEGERPTLAATI